MDLLLLKNAHALLHDRPGILAVAAANAASRGHVSILELLTQSGHDALGEDCKPPCPSALFEAARCGQRVTLDWLLLRQPLRIAKSGNTKTNRECRPKSLGGIKLFRVDSPTQAPLPCTDDV